MKEQIELIKPAPYERIPLESCNKYMCCVNCKHFYCSGMSAPNGYCGKAGKKTDATRHCKEFEEGIRQ